MSWTDYGLDNMKLISILARVGKGRSRLEINVYMQPHGV